MHPTQPLSSMEKNPKILSNGSRSSTATNSPEFEFWMIGNQSSDQPTLHSADELFSGGILLPLHHLNTQNSDDPPDKNPPPTNPDPDSGNGSDLRTTAVSASKRWKDIFKKNPENKEKEKKKKKEKTGFSGTGGGSGGGGGSSSAELNINIWPFSRSRSAGTGGGRPRTAAGNRKVSSAPCSRSNSTGESKYRKWPGSPNRGGVHLGRSSPVWQVKRFGQSKSLHDDLVRTAAGKSSRPAKMAGAGGNGKVLNVNVPACIGYRQRMGCRSDVIEEGNGGGDGGVTAVSGGGEGGGSGLFNFRSLFTKKVF